jgi:PPK2 family polyphosphate:nucleotide phosphotransferase
MDSNTLDQYRVDPGTKVNLKEWDPDDLSRFPLEKDAGKELLRDLNRELERLQELFYAAHQCGLLIVLQAMDAGGKDGTIRHVFDGVNPQGVKVANFKVPTALELDHDYLWRIHRRTPAKGEFVIFNRSHYEDVLVVRVRDIVPEEVWSKRYEQINNFERLLADEGTRILKFYLHIDKAEQKERFQARLDEPGKNWKFNPKDLADRERWDDYMQAYEEAISRTSTAWAPWYIIPANRKWYRNVVISSILVHCLTDLDLKLPDAQFDPASIVID